MSVTLMALVWPMELPTTDKVVLLALADAANDDGVTWIAVHSRRQGERLDLKKKCSLSERAIQGAVKRLEAEGLIERVERPGKGVIYTVKPPQQMRPAADAPPQQTAPTPAADAGKPSVTINEGVKTPSERVVDAWKEMAKKHDLPDVRILDASRKQSLRLRIKSAGLEAMLEAVEIVGRSDWLSGRDRTGSWRPTLDFILQPESLRKVLEGAYGGVEGRKADPVKMDWEAQAKFFEKINRPDDAADCRRRGAQAAVLISNITRSLAA